MTRNQTNVERVTRYMEYGSPLNQAFVIEAVTRYAEECVANKEQLIAAMEGSTIHGPAWARCAEDWMKSNERTVEACDNCEAAGPLRREGDEDLCHQCADVHPGQYNHDPEKEKFYVC